MFFLKYLKIINKRFGGNRKVFVCKRYLLTRNDYLIRSQFNRVRHGCADVVSNHECGLTPNTHQPNICVFLR